MKPTHTHEPQSTAISKIEWWRDRGTLAVTFTSGKVYRYGDVPEEAFKNFRDAPSAGRHFGMFVKPFFKEVG